MSRSDAVRRTLPLVVAAYVVFQPLLDCLTAFAIRAQLPVTPGVVMRALFMVLGLVYTVWISRFPQKKWVWGALGAIGAYLLVFLVHLFRLGGLGLCLRNIQEIVKTFYAPLVLIFLWSAYRELGFLASTRAIAWAGGLYAGVILLAYLTGTSFVSYGSSGYGYNGWFHAANEVSCILALTAPVTVYYCVTQLPTVTRKTWYRGVGIAWTLFSVAFSANFIGTKIVFLFIALYCLAAGIWAAVQALRTPSRGAWVRFAVLALLCVTVFLLYFRSSLQSYLNNVYVEIMDENSEMSQLSFSEEIEAMTRGTWLRTLLDQNPLVERVDQILSRRLLSSAATVQSYLDGGLAVKLFGVGYANCPALTHDVELMVEMDLVAVLVRHGVVGFVVYILPYLGFIAWAVVRFVRHPLETLGSLKTATYLFVTLAGFAIALIAGHALVSPAVSLFVLLGGMQLFACWTRGTEGEGDL